MTKCRARTGRWKQCQSEAQDYMGEPRDLCSTHRPRETGGWGFVMQRWSPEDEKLERLLRILSEDVFARTAEETKALVQKEVSSW